MSFPIQCKMANCIPTRWRWRPNETRNHDRFANKFVNLRYIINLYVTYCCCVAVHHLTVLTAFEWHKLESMKIHKSSMKVSTKAIQLAKSQRMRWKKENHSQMILGKKCFFACRISPEASKSFDLNWNRKWNSIPQSMAYCHTNMPYTRVSASTHTQLHAQKHRIAISRNGNDFAWFIYHQPKYA